MYRSILLVLVIVGLVCVHVHGQNIGGEGGEGSVFMGVGRQGMGRLFGVRILIDQRELYDDCE